MAFQFKKTMYDVPHSRMLSAIGHDVDEKTNTPFIQVMFPNKVVYQYWPFPKEKFAEIFGTKEKGTWFDTNVRKNKELKYEKIGEQKLNL